MAGSQEAPFAFSQLSKNPVVGRVAAGSDTITTARSYSFFRCKPSELSVQSAAPRRYHYDGLSPKWPDAVVCPERFFVGTVPKVEWLTGAAMIRKCVSSGSSDVKRDTSLLRKLGFHGHTSRSKPQDALPVREAGMAFAPRGAAESGASLPNSCSQLFDEDHAGRPLHQLATGPL